MQKRAEIEALGLIPEPRRVSVSQGSFEIDHETEIATSGHDAERALAFRLADWLAIPRSRVRTFEAGVDMQPNTIALRLERASDADSTLRDASVDFPRDAADEAYVLEVTPEGASVRAREPAGLFYGAQTLAQVAVSRPIEPAGSRPTHSRPIPSIRIEDAPALLVRAMHLDVARHFFDKESVRRFIDLIAFYRFNIFHWHLSDDQGFRFQVRAHPELTEIGAQRTEDGRVVSGFYTHDDVREIVAYAKDRFITVIPEFDSPGHARAILAAHPELSCTGAPLPVPTTAGIFEDVLCAGNEDTYFLLGNMLAEALELFPSRLVHIGGDEVPKKRWKECPKCRAKMNAENLTIEQLQGSFTQRLAALVGARGRRVVVWDEALEGGLPQGAIVAAWQSKDRGRAAAAAGHDVIMVPVDATYLDHWQSNAQPPSEPGYGLPVLPWTTVLAFDPRLDASAGTGSILGGEGTLWTENVRTREEIEMLLLPRMAALADALWRTRASPEEAILAGEDVHGGAAQSFAARFRAQRRLLDAAAVQYFVEPPVGLRPRRLFLEHAVLELAPPSIHSEGVVRYTLDGTEPNETSPRFVAPIELRSSTYVAARLFLPGGRTSAVTRGAFERTHLRPAAANVPPRRLREGVYYTYFEVEARALPAFATLEPRTAGTLPSLSLDVALRAEDFAMVFDAWILAPEDGIYRFVARADDGVAVDIDGVRVVEDDGEHAARDADGEIALARGLHAVHVEYFQAKLGKELSLSCEGPSMVLAACVLLTCDEP